MDWLSAIAACSLHGDLSLVIAMAITFSRGNPYTVQNVAEEATHTYQQQEDPLRPPVPGAAKALKTRAEAETQMRNIVSSDGAPVVGLLPAPVSWAGLFGRKPTELFNSCVNVSIATAKLAEFEYECGKKGGRSCVLKQYAQAVGMDYLEQDVLAELAEQGLSKQGSAIIETEEMLRAPLKAAAAAEDRDRQWGADRLFFVLPTTAPARSGGAGGQAAAAPPAQSRRVKK